MKKEAPNLAICAMSMMLMAPLGIAPGLSGIAEAFPDISANTIALLITLPTIVVMVVSLFVAAMNQYLSKRNLALLGIGIICVAGTVPYFLNSFGAILVSRLVLGVGLGLVNPIAASLPMDHFPIGKERIKSIGLQSAFSGGGGLLFTLIGGYLAVVGWRAIFLVYLLPLSAFLIIWLYLPDLGVVKKENDTLFSINKAVVLYGGLSWLYMTVFMTLSLNISYLLESMGGTPVQAGYGTAAASVTSFIGGLLLAQITGIFKKYTYGLTMMVSAAGLIMMGMVQNWIMVSMGAALAGVGMCIIISTGFKKVSEAVKPQAVTFSISLLLACTSIGQFTSPYTSTLLAGLGDGGVQAKYIFPGITLFIAAIIVILLSIKKNDIA